MYHQTPNAPQISATPGKSPKRQGNIYTLAILLAIITAVTVTHEAAHYVIAKKHGVKILEASYGFGPRLLTYDYKGTRYSISAIPLGGYVSMQGEQDRPATLRSANSPLFNAQPDPVQMSILLAGPLTNILTGSILMLILRPPTRKKQGTLIGEVIQGSPAEESGVSQGESITAINETPVNTAHDIQKLIKRLPSNKQLSLTLEKDKHTRQVMIQPQQKRTLSLTLFPITIPMLGIRLAHHMTKAKNAIPVTAKDIFQPFLVLIVLPLSLTCSLLKRHIKLSDIVIGPIGLFYMVKSLMASGKATALELFAMISLSIGFTNALPIPILDGGRAAIIMTEKAMQAPLTETVSHATNFTGAMFLLTLLVFTLFTDISKVRKGKKQAIDPFDIADDPIL